MGRAASDGQLGRPLDALGVSGWPSSACSAAVARTRHGRHRGERDARLRAHAVRQRELRGDAHHGDVQLAPRRVAQVVAAAARPGRGDDELDAAARPAPSTVRRTPRKNDAIGTRRWPFGPAITASASSARSGGAMSADGAALQRLPPSVARLRTWMEPTSAPLSASAG